MSFPVYASDYLVLTVVTVCKLLRGPYNITVSLRVYSTQNGYARSKGLTYENTRRKVVSLMVYINSLSNGFNDMA